MDRQVTFRIAGPPDAPSITSVINEAFRCAENFFVDRDRLDLKEVLKLLDTGRFLLAEENAVVLGCVYVEPQHGDGEMRAYLGLLSVDPREQRAGLGSKLMDAAEEYCRNLGCRFMDIRVVNLRQELPHYYHRRGYVDTGTESFPAEIETKVPCHFIRMSKSLR